MNRLTLQISFIGYWLLAISCFTLFKSSSNSEVHPSQMLVEKPDVLPVFNNPKIVVLGSSTAAGAGAWPYSQSWVGLLDTWLQGRVSSYQLTNLAVGGYSTYNVIATGNPDRNITKALSLNPDIILVNLPSNNVAGSIPLETTISHYYQLKQAADNAGVLIYFTTTQPRNFTDPETSKRQALQTETARIRQEFGSFVVDIYDELTDFTNDLRVKSNYSAGDGIHLNNSGHNYIYGKVIEKLSSVIPASSPSYAVKSFRLINATNDQVITELQNGSTIILSNMPTSSFNIEALTDPGVVGSIRWQLTGPKSVNILENFAAYALFGNNNSDFYGQSLPTGDYTLTATPYTQSAGQGSVGTALNIQFQVIQSQPNQNPGINTFLVNAITNQDIQELTQGTVIDLSKLSTNMLNVRSVFSQGSVGSISFQLTGAANTSRVESTAPYALFGDAGGNYNDWTAVVGNYQLTVKAYSGAGASGNLLGTQTIDFSIVNNTNNTPPPVGVAIESLLLINAQTNQGIQFLQNGNVLNLAQLGTQSFNVSANTSGTIQKVGFNLDNTLIRSESVAPYALFGDAAGVFNGQAFALGNHNLTVTPYDLNGVAGTPLVVSFSVVSGNGAKVAQSSSSILAYPNPNPGEGIRIANFTKNDPPVEVIIYNALQKEVLREQVKSENLEEVYIRLPKGLMPGTYYMMVRSSNSTRVLPIMVR